MTSDNSNTKPQTWCATTPSSNLNKADQAPILDSATMAFSEKKVFYPCQTQEGVSPTVDLQLVDGADDGENELVVGTGSIIPRWSVLAPGPTNLLYFVVRDGFPSQEASTYTATAFQQAAGEWNKIGFGVKISETHDKKLANFAIRYTKPAVDKGVLASAFFPNVVKDVLVYDKTLVNPKWKAILKNSFLHEIGHILGLRHEFAIKADAAGHGPEKDKAVQFGSENPHSVMSYDDKNEIQDTDKEDIVKFYKLVNGAEIDSVSKLKITDYVPKPLTNL
ncbi:hypothetical protein GQ44DRAFT_760109 [Phaeosphaeriaceae sp. PMI808]|nr:hypothetical protein GQ44DRAFT_760109 [Phaeosphaeriaceae sp. PMI808]